MYYCQHNHIDLETPPSQGFVNSLNGQVPKTSHHGEARASPPSTMVPPLISILSNPSTKATLIVKQEFPYYTSSSTLSSSSSSSFSSLHTSFPSVSLPGFFLPDSQQITQPPLQQHNTPASTSPQSPCCHTAKDAIGYIDRSGRVIMNPCSCHDKKNCEMISLSSQRPQMEDDEVLFRRLDEERRLYALSHSRKTLWQYDAANKNNSSFSVPNNNNSFSSTTTYSDRKGFAIKSPAFKAPGLFHGENSAFKVHHKEAPYRGIKYQPMEVSVNKPFETCTNGEKNAEGSRNMESSRSIESSRTMESSRSGVDGRADERFSDDETEQYDCPSPFLKSYDDISPSNFYSSPSFKMQVS